MHDWLLKLRFRILYRLAKLVEIRPSLQVDPDQYCPACGSYERKEIQAVDLEKPDASGSVVGVALACKVCKYQFLNPTVTVIKEHMGPPEQTEEQKEFEQMASDKRTKSIRTVVKVNER